MIKFQLEKKKRGDRNDDRSMEVPVIKFILRKIIVRPERTWKPLVDLGRTQVNM